MPQNWWVDSSPALNAPGGATVGGGGYGTQAISYRSELDARRSMAGPESQYPDGYLGTIIDRQQDKLLQAVQSQLNQRSYQRGVHVGSKIGREQYEWTPDVNPMAGIERQAQAIPDISTGAVRFITPRHAPTLDVAERLAHLGKTASAAELEAMARRTGVPVGSDPAPVDQAEYARLQHLMPRLAI